MAKDETSMDNLDAQPEGAVMEDPGMDPAMQEEPMAEDLGGFRETLDQNADADKGEDSDPGDMEAFMPADQDEIL